MVFSLCDELALCFNMLLNSFHISITSRTNKIPSGIDFL